MWVKSNIQNIPPKTHNLLTLLKGVIELSDEGQLFLIKLNQYQIEGRYPEDIQKLYAITNEELTNQYFEKIKAISSCLLKKMP